MKYKFKITGFGSYLPPKVEDSKEVAEKINKSSDWIIYCVAASLPLALTIAHKNKKISKNSLIFLVGTGAGLSIASALIKI